MQFSFLVTLAVAIIAAAAAPPKPRQGTQFITGPCDSDADCASGCCGFNTGKCAGAIIALERDNGCGRGDATPNGNAAKALGFTGPIPGPGAAATAPMNNGGNKGGNKGGNNGGNNGATPSTGSGKPPGTQFITGPCGSDADCASSCCGFNSGKCAGPIIAQERDNGCGHGDAEPNSRAADALRGNRRK